MKTEQPALHVVLGAGQIGSRITELLLAKGHRVRVVRRSEHSATHERLEVARGDMMNVDFARDATRGAAVVYDCMNPVYPDWHSQLLPMGRGALEGARAAGARLVALDCLYMYGRVSAPMREDTPMRPCSKKGVLRVDLANLRLDAHRRGDVEVAIGRASDFFGAGLPYSFWSDRFFERIYAGKAGECMGDPDMPHAYTNVGDVARALVTLGEDPRAPGHVWHVPTNAAESTRALATRVGDALGLDVKMARMPKLLLRAIGLFSPFMRELAEMTYQWDIPFAVDDTRFRTTFGYGPTPVDTAVAEVAAWARGRFDKLATVAAAG